MLPRKQQDLPSSWGTFIRLHMFQSDSGRTAHVRPIRHSSVALGMQKAKAPTTGLSELNSMAFGLAVYASQSWSPRPTQDSLPVASQALLDGTHTREVPMKGFKVVSYISFSFPKLAWRNCIIRSRFLDRPSRTLLFFCA